MWKVYSDSKQDLTSLRGPTCLHSCLLKVAHIILFKQTPWQQWCKQINVNERIHPSGNNKKEGKRGWGEQSNNSSDGALFKKSFKFGVVVTALLVKNYDNISWSSATYLLAFTAKKNQNQNTLT